VGGGVLSLAVGPGLVIAASMSLNVVSGLSQRWRLARALENPLKMRSVETMQGTHDAVVISQTGVVAGNESGSVAIPNEAFNRALAPLSTSNSYVGTLGLNGAARNLFVNAVKNNSFRSAMAGPFGTPVQQNERLTPIVAGAAELGLSASSSAAPALNVAANQCLVKAPLVKDVPTVIASSVSTMAKESVDPSDDSCRLFAQCMGKVHALMLEFIPTDEFLDTASYVQKRAYHEGVAVELSGKAQEMTRSSKNENSNSYRTITAGTAVAKHHYASRAVAHLGRASGGLVAGATLSEVKERIGRVLRAANDSGTKPTAADGAAMDASIRPVTNQMVNVVTLAAMSTCTVMELADYVSIGKYFEGLSYCDVKGSGAISAEDAMFALDQVEGQETVLRVGRRSVTSELRAKVPLRSLASGVTQTSLVANVWMMALREHMHDTYGGVSVSGGDDLACSNEFSQVRRVGDLFGLRLTEEPSVSARVVADVLAFGPNELDGAPEVATAQYRSGRPVCGIYFNKGGYFQDGQSTYYMPDPLVMLRKMGDMPPSRQDPGERLRAMMGHCRGPIYDQLNEMLDSQGVPAYVEIDPELRSYALKTSGAHDMVEETGLPEVLLPLAYALFGITTDMLAHIVWWVTGGCVERLDFAESKKPQLFHSTHNGKAVKGLMMLRDRPLSASQMQEVALVFAAATGTKYPVGRGSMMLHAVCSERKLDCTDQSVVDALVSELWDKWYTPCVEPVLLEEAQPYALNLRKGFEEEVESVLVHLEKPGPGAVRALMATNVPGAVALAAAPFSPTVVRRVGPPMRVPSVPVTTRTTTMDHSGSQDMLTRFVKDGVITPREATAPIAPADLASRTAHVTGMTTSLGADIDGVVFNLRYVPPHHTPSGSMKSELRVLASRVNKPRPLAKICVDEPFVGAFIVLLDGERKPCYTKGSRTVLSWGAGSGKIASIVQGARHVLKRAGSDDMVICEASFRVARDNDSHLHALIVGVDPNKIGVNVQLAGTAAVALSVAEELSRGVVTDFLAARAGQRPGPAHSSLWTPAEEESRGSEPAAAQGGGVPAASVTPPFQPSSPTYNPTSPPMVGASGVELEDWEELLTG